MSYTAASPAEIKKVAEDLLGPLLADHRAKMNEIQSVQRQVEQRDKDIRRDLLLLSQKMDRQTAQFIAIRTAVFNRIADLENQK